MTRTTRSSPLWFYSLSLFLLSFLVLDISAVPRLGCSGAQCEVWRKRQASDSNSNNNAVVVTETWVTVISETETATFTETFTTASASSSGDTVTDDPASSTISFSNSDSDVSESESWTESWSASASASVTLGVHLVDDQSQSGLGSSGSGQGVLFLPLDSLDVALPAGTGTVDSDSESVTQAAPTMTMTATSDSDPASSSSSPIATTMSPSSTSSAVSSSSGTGAGTSSSVSASLPAPSMSILSSLTSAAPTVSTTVLPTPDLDPSPSDSDEVVYSSTSGAIAAAAATPVVKGPLVSAYYPDWVSDTFPPENIDMSRFDWIDFAFALPDAKFGLGWDDPSVPGILKRVVSAAHAKNTKVKLSVGGWTGSKYFSAACATSSNRNTFVANVVSAYKQYNLDGIDFDWEYPGQQGAGNNIVSPQDSANFLSMLQLLRRNLPASARISAAVTDTPFVGPNGQPLKDVSGFAAVLDWVNVMNYDVFGSSSSPGPNAPLSNACKDSTQPSANAVAALNAWSAAKFPINRLMLGVPAYGYLSASKSTTLQHKRSLAARQFPVPVFDQDLDLSETVFDATENTTASFSDSGSGSGSGLSSNGGLGSSQRSPLAASAPLSFPSDSASESASDASTDTDTDASTLGVTVDAETAQALAAAAASTPGTITLKSDEGSTTSGTINLSSLLSQGALLPARVGRTTSAVTFLAIGGFTRFWDSCSSTPFLVNPYTSQVVAYDDMQSLGLKAGVVKSMGALGTAMWDMSGDTAQWDLTNSLRIALGKSV